MTAKAERVTGLLVALSFYWSVNERYSYLRILQVKPVNFDGFKIRRTKRGNNGTQAEKKLVGECHAI